MQLNLFVRDVQSDQIIPVKVVPASDADLKQTASAGWQTSWNTQTARRFPNRVALKTETNELLGLMSYAADEKFMAVEVVYLESQPESNANLLHSAGQAKRYLGIAKALFAHAVKESVENGFDGVVLFKAKTDTLLRYYIREFGARQVGRYDPLRLVIWEDAAQNLIKEYEVGNDE